MAKQEVAQQQAQLIVNNALIDQLTVQLEEKKKYGLTFPPDFNPTNALMGAYLTLKEATDKSGKSVLETCSQASIANCLMDMVTLGVSVQKKQAYFIPYGGKLQLQVSYHGKKAIAHRCGVKKINAEVIYEGDTFKYHMENGVKILDLHNQDFMNIDLSKIIGAYAVLELADGSNYMEVMNMNQIKTAWKKGFGYKEGSGTHAEFTDMMAKKTVVKRACNNFIQQYGDNYVVSSYENAEEVESMDKVVMDVEHDIEVNANAVDFTEVAEQEEVEKCEGEVVEETPVKTDAKGTDEPDWVN